MKVISFTIPVRRDQTVIIRREEGAQFYPHLHRHEEVQLTCIQKGAGTLVVGEQLLSFDTGTIFLFPSNLPHLFKNEPSPSGFEKPEIVALSLFFRKDNLIWSLPELKQVAQFLTQMQSACRVLPAYQDMIQNTLMNIEEQPENLRLAPFIELMQDLVHSTKLAVIGGSAVSGVSDQEGLRMDAILQYAMEHYDRSIRLEEVARLVHMVPGSFCRFFKQRTGKTFIRFLNELRIREACHQLAFQHDVRIAEIAFQCGFKNVSSFNRVFRHLKGQSPSEYLAGLQEVV